MTTLIPAPLLPSRTGVLEVKPPPQAQSLFLAKHPPLLYPNTRRRDPTWSNSNSGVKLLMRREGSLLTQCRLIKHCQYVCMCVCARVCVYTVASFLFLASRRPLIKVSRRQTRGNKSCSLVISPHANCQFNTCWLSRLLFDQLRAFGERRGQDPERENAEFRRLQPLHSP